MVFNKSKSIFVSVVLLAMFVFCTVTLPGCKKTPTENKPVIPSNPDVKREDPETLSLSDALTEIVSKSNGWGPILKDLYGKEIPDFKFRDLDGNSHKFSSYKGKKIMVVLWATWCLPCKQEVPHLIALRNIMSEKNLAIIAISAGESDAAVQQMAGKMNMNYTVALMSAYPQFLNQLRGYPTAFFVNPDGTVKIITEGRLYLGDMKSILLAE
ncbi:MAG: TlpA family protein disulfide reductase [Anaerohalosphaeraceae bacterium]|nr:TlpA family protein disulfide reductase [Anaerohalosphaeraceae bacterium]